MTAPHPGLLFVAFAAGYFCSALLRAVTATLAPDFSRELGLGPGDLGLLAGAFFAGFALTQLPLGSALDRYGPKRVLMGFMAVGALACALFAVAQSFESLVLARALMGVGLSANLMAALTCFRRHYSPGNQLRANSWMLMSGSLGMVMATLPVHALTPLVGWRGLFWLLALVILLCIGLLLWAVPGDRASASAPTGQAAAGGGYGTIVRHPTFIRLLPLGLWHYAGLLAIQTLWAGPWLTRVAGLAPGEAAAGLFIINLSMLVAFALLGAVAPGLAARGWHAQRLTLWMAPVSIAVLGLVLWWGPQAGVTALALWCLSCVPLSLCQPAVGQAFPQQLVGRALSAYNLAIFLGVFLLQWGLGLTVDLLLRWGWTEVSAFRGAFSLFGMGCLLSYAWFLWWRPAAAPGVPSATRAE